MWSWNHLVLCVAELPVSPWAAAVFARHTVDQFDLLILYLVLRMNQFRSVQWGRLAVAMPWDFRIVANASLSTFTHGMKTIPLCGSLLRPSKICPRCPVWPCRQARREPARSPGQTTFRAPPHPFPSPSLFSPPSPPHLPLRSGPLKSGGPGVCPPGKFFET